MGRKQRNRSKPAPVTGRDRGIRLAKVTIENPDWEPAKEGVAGVPRFEQRDKNTKESAVETLFARKFLGSAQKLAADKFRELWETAGGKTSSIDYTLDRVDGGKGDPISAKLIAAQELVRLRNQIGQRGFDVLEKVCGEGMALADLTLHKRERLTVADNLRADLDDAATMWRMQTRQRGVAA